ncbi:MAG: hypothetical protein JNM63_13740 [Spirochaetia bacterium]|nr:hypothetical protein [Spirochaetia bacterium]
MKSPSVLLTCFFALIAWVNAAPLSTNAAPLFRIESTVDKNAVSVGDPILYTVVIRFDPKLRVAKPGPGEGLGSFEIKDYRLHKTIVGEDGVAVDKVEYDLAVYETGTFFIPPARARAQIGGKEVEIQSETLRVEIRSVLSNAMTDIRDLKDPELPLGFIPIRYYVYTALPPALVGLFFLSRALFRAWRKKRRSTIPAYEEAILALEELLSKKYLEKQRFREFYYGLSELFRRFVERTENVPCLTLTTRQILTVFDGHPYAHKEFLRECLSYSDRVKFAQFTPDEAKTRFFIEELKNLFLEAKQKALLQGKAAP